MELRDLERDLHFRLIPGQNSPPTQRGPFLSEWASSILSPQRSTLHTLSRAVQSALRGCACEDTDEQDLQKVLPVTVFCDLLIRDHSQFRRNHREWHGSQRLRQNHAPRHGRSCPPNGCEGWWSRGRFPQSLDGGGQERAIRSSPRPRTLQNSCQR